MKADPNVFDIFIKAIDAAGLWTKQTVKELKQVHNTLSTTVPTPYQGLNSRPAQENFCQDTSSNQASAFN